MGTLAGVATGGVLPQQFVRSARGHCDEFADGVAVAAGDLADPVDLHRVGHHDRQVELLGEDLLVGVHRQSGDS